MTSNKERTMKVTFEFLEKAASSILTTAVEGGSNYWINDYTGLKVVRDKESWVTELKIGKAKKGTESEGTDPKHFTIDARRIAAALGEMLSHPEKPGAWAAGDVVKNTDSYGCGSDANACDVVLQFAVFDELVYG